jgi:hypothetical protein
VTCLYNSKQIKRSGCGFPRSAAQVGKNLSIKIPPFARIHESMGETAVSGGGLHSVRFFNYRERASVSNGGKSKKEYHP